MHAEHVDFSAWIAEERSQPPGDDLERTLPWRAVLLPVVARHDQEQVLGVRRRVPSTDP